MMPMTPSGTRTRAMSRPLGRVHCAIGGADGIGQRGDVLDAARHGLDALCIERQAIEHGAGQPLGARRLHVARHSRLTTPALRARNAAAIVASAAILGGGARQRQHRGRGHGLAARAQSMTAAMIRIGGLVDGGVHGFP